MTFPVQIGPSTITINRDDRVLVCQPDGRILGEDDGFFTRDTRFISGYEMRINGVRPLLLSSAPIQFFSSRFEFTNDALVDIDGPIPRQSLALRLDRTVADGVHEDYDLVNYSRRPVRLDRRDLDPFRFRGHLRREARPDRCAAGSCNTRWFRSRGELRSSYVNGDFRRDLIVAVERSSSTPSSPTGASCSSRRSRPRTSGTPA